MTSEAPRQMFATSSSATPRPQSVPETKNMRQAATAPTQANPAKRRVGRTARSAIAPTTISTRAETIVETVAV